MRMLFSNCVLYLKLRTTRIMVLKGIWNFPSTQEGVDFGHISVLMIPVWLLAPSYLSTWDPLAGLFFEHFEKIQGLQEKNSRHILEKKLKRVEST